MPFFEYGSAELAHLKRRDKHLGQAIDRIGKIEREVRPDLFAALVHSIVAQQVSAKAATTVWNRLCCQCGEMTPAVLATADADRIQQCGLSRRKVAYMQKLGQAVAQNTLDLDEIPSLSDVEIVRRLSGLNGIGVWTAEMLLIFSLQRPNVVSWGDLAIRRGMMALYGRKSLDRTAFDRYCRRYSPYGSIASLYLWHIAAETPPAKSSGSARRIEHAQ